MDMFPSTYILITALSPIDPTCSDSAKQHNMKMTPAGGEKREPHFFFFGYTKSLNGQTGLRGGQRCQSELYFIVPEHTHTSHA